MLLSALLLLIPALLPQDRVVLVDGETVSGDVTQARLAQVTVTTSDGSERKLETAQVLEVDYGDVPEELTRAAGFLEAMDYQNAVSAYDAAANAGGKPWVAEMAALGKARALLAWSSVDPSRAAEAAEAFRNWVSTYPDSFFVIDAKVGLAHALARSGQADEGARILEELSSQAFEKNLGRQVEQRAKLERALVYLAGDQPQVAETRLRDLIPTIQESVTSTETPAALRPVLRSQLSRAQIGLGDAIEAKGGPTAARAYWEGLLRDRRATVDVRAAAEIGLAATAAEAGNLREAQFRLARVVASMDASPEVMARALFRLAEACDALQDDLAASKDYYERVVRDYPNTSWAVQAREALGG